MSPSNQTWRTTPPSKIQLHRITSLPTRPVPAPIPQPPADDSSSLLRRFNLFDGTANVPPRPDYFINERRTYFKLLKRKINSAPLPPLPPKIEYGETIPWHEWCPRTPPSEVKEGIRLPRSYWQSRFGGWDRLWETKPITYYEFANTDVCWSEELAKIPFGKRGSRRWIYGYWRSTYFKPIVRPVWEWEFSFVGDGWTPG